jgi:hypothetical protein
MAEQGRAVPAELAAAFGASADFRLPPVAPSGEAPAPAGRRWDDSAWLDGAAAGFGLDASLHLLPPEASASMGLGAPLPPPGVGVGAPVLSHAGGPGRRPAADGGGGSGLEVYMSGLPDMRGRGLSAVSAASNLSDTAAAAAALSASYLSGVPLGVGAVRGMTRSAAAASASASAAAPAATAPDPLSTLTGPMVAGLAHPGDGGRALAASASMLAGDEAMAGGGGEGGAEAEAEGAEDAWEESEGEDGAAADDHSVDAAGKGRGTGRRSSRASTGDSKRFKGTSDDRRLMR